MAKLSLTDLSNLGGDPTSAQTAINANNAAIEAAMDKAVFRDGTSPNTMSADLDMNSHKILNLPYATTAGEPLTYGQWQANDGTDWSAAIALKANIVHTHVAADITDFTSASNTLINAAIGNINASGVSNGDKGDITVSGGGVVWTIDNAAVTYAKVQNVSATDKILGRSTAGAGTIEEITCTATARSLLDDTSTSAMLTTLGAAAASHTHAATDITSGLLNDARLNTTIPRYADSTANFTGDLQVGGVSVGTKIIPQNSQSGNYTCVLGDNGKHILHPAAAGAGHTFTIPANSSVAYPIGTAITFVNLDASNNLSIAITTDTMYLAGSGTTGTRTLGTYGQATALKVGTTTWIISGTDLT